MDASPIIGVWPCEPGRLPRPFGALEDTAPEPLFRGTIVRDQGDLLVVRVEGAAPPPAPPETLYRVDGRGLFVESRRAECLSPSQGRLHVLLVMTSAASGSGEFRLSPVSEPLGAVPGQAVNLAPSTVRELIRVLDQRLGELENRNGRCTHCQDAEAAAFLRRMKAWVGQKP